MESTWLLDKSATASDVTKADKGIVAPLAVSTSSKASFSTRSNGMAHFTSLLSPPSASPTPAKSVISDPQLPWQETECVYNPEKLFSAQVRVYLITFIAYAMSHYARKSYTFFKTNMNIEDGVPIQLQGWLDSVFMLAYAFGSFFSGNLGDQFDPPTVVAIGMMGAGTCVGLLILGLWSGLVVDYYTYTALFLLFVWMCHGAFQSTGGPVNTAIMGNWFSPEHRGVIFGSWTCHQYTGNILGAISSSLMLTFHIHYYWALTLPVFANFAWAAVVFFYLPARPEDIGLQLEAHKHKHASPLSNSQPSPQTPSPIPLSMIASPSIVPHHHHIHPQRDNKPAITILQAFKIPMVSMYALAFGFFKLTNYTLFFWLPFFLSHSFSPSEANLISMLYDFGMMPGGILVGALSDYFGGRRTSVCAAMLLALCPLLLFFGVYSESLPVPALLGLLGLLGLLVGGPNNIITSAVAADVALHPAIGGNHRALGTVTGIINGSGSITAALGLVLVTWMQQHLGWMYVWVFLVIGTLIGCSLLVPRILEEIRDKSDDYQPISIAISQSVSEQQQHTGGDTRSPNGSTNTPTQLHLAESRAN